MPMLEEIQDKVKPYKARFDSWQGEILIIIEGPWMGASQTISKDDLNLPIEEFYDRILKSMLVKLDEIARNKKKEGVKNGLS